MSDHDFADELLAETFRTAHLQAKWNLLTYIERDELAEAAELLALMIALQSRQQ